MDTSGERMERLQPKPGEQACAVFDVLSLQQVKHRRSIELDLHAALETDQLSLEYQPIISCRTGAILGLEALLRWQHPVHGEIPPAVFIPIAENSGFFCSLGEWVFNRAMKDSKRWPDLEVSVNLSPVQFRRLDLESTLRELVAEHRVEPHRFVLEITEGVLLEASDHTHSVLETIRAMGFKIALDDFGSGYSNLAYLCNFQFDKIKIARSFISRISTDDITRTVVQSVVKLARALGMGIVAEGIETESEALMMTRFGCTELQGYYFSPPATADRMAELLTTFKPKLFHSARNTGADLSSRLKTHHRNRVGA